MKKTVIFEFSDDFEFPECFGGYESACDSCPMYMQNDYGSEICFLIHPAFDSLLARGKNIYDGKCPFHNGSASVEFKETEFYKKD